MKFSELVRLLEHNGFAIIKEKGSIRYYGKPGVERLVRIDYHGSKEVPTGTCHASYERLGSPIGRGNVINLKYSLVIEATVDPTFFGFYSPDLDGFTGISHSIEDCLYQARWGMEEYLAILKDRGLPIPTPSSNPTVVIHNERRVGQAV